MFAQFLRSVYCSPHSRFAVYMSNFQSTFSIRFRYKSHPTHTPTYELLLLLFNSRTTDWRLNRERRYTEMFNWNVCLWLWWLLPAAGCQIMMRTYAWNDQMDFSAIAISLQCEWWNRANVWNSHANGLNWIRVPIKNSLNLHFTFSMEEFFFFASQKKSVSTGFSDDDLRTLTFHMKQNMCAMVCVSVNRSKCTGKNFYRLEMCIIKRKRKKKKYFSR